MSLGDRDKRALMLLGGAVVIAGVFAAATGMFSSPSATAEAVPSSSTLTIPDAERTLAAMRRSVARTPGKTEILKKAEAELAAREKGLIQADTANQAQAQLLETVSQLARTEGIEIRNKEFVAPRSYGDNYAEIVVTLTFECRIEQLVNMMAALSSRPELIATNDLKMSAANAKQKTVTVRLGVSGLVSRKLLPERTGPTA
jgi:hypothetical protein